MQADICIIGNASGVAIVFAESEIGVSRSNPDEATAFAFKQIRFSKL